MDASGRESRLALSDNSRLRVSSAPSSWSRMLQRAVAAQAVVAATAPVVAGGGGGGGGGGSGGSAGTVSARGIEAAMANATVISAKART